MPDLEKLRKALNDAQAAFTGALTGLEDKYRKAQQAYADDRSDANYKKYKKAKQDFVEARREVRRMEEQDPNNSRGQGEGVGLVTISDEEGAA